MVDPWPFASGELTVRCTGRRLTGRSETESELHAALAEAGARPLLHAGAAVTRRQRLWAYRTCVALVVAGAVCAVVVDGLTGDVLLIGLSMAGFGGALLLVFFEVGLSEDQGAEREGGAPRAGAGSAAQASAAAAPAVVSAVLRRR